MNLWVKRVGQLMMAAALFFLSCEEEITLLGYQANQRFEVKYLDIPLETSVLLIDSIRTSNLAQETNRLLAGRYSDPLLGEVVAGAFTQFYRSSVVPDSMSFAVFDSVSLHLAYDYYLYGDPGTGEQQIAIYEMADTLANPLTTLPLYYSNSVKPLGNQIGSKSFVIDPSIFREIVEDDIDTTLKVRITLDNEFGKRIFDAAERLDGATSVDDSLYVKLDRFVQAFKGISVQSVQGDKIIGFNPGSSQSRIVVHFHINKRDSLVLGFGGLSGFSNISADRSASDVAGLENYHEPFFPASGTRHIQNGVGVVTALDLTNFLNFADTIPVMIINSAELLIPEVPDKTEDQPAPTSLILRALADNYRFRTLRTQADSSLIVDYGGTLNTSFAVVADDRVNQLSLGYDAEDNQYNGFMTLFLQELYRNRELAPVSRLALFPTIPPIGKSVNNVSFDSQNIKLRVYYTIPTLNQNQ